MRRVVRHGKFCDVRDQFTLPQPGLENCATLMAPHGSAVWRDRAFPYQSKLACCPGPALADVLRRQSPGSRHACPLPVATAEKIVALAKASNPMNS